MPLIYADTSALLAYFHPRDVFSRTVTDTARAQAPDFVYWTFIRFELRHNLRRARINRYGEAAWQALRAAEGTQARLRWQANLQCDSLLESAEELSAQYALDYGAGSADFLHIAAARRLAFTSGMDEFWTCDAAQAAAAKVAGLSVRLFELKHPPAQSPAT